MSVRFANQFLQTKVVYGVMLGVFIGLKKIGNSILAKYFCWNKGFANIMLNFSNSPIFPLFRFLFESPVSKKSPVFQISPV